MLPMSPVLNQPSFKCGLGFFGTVPIAFEHRWAAHQDFAVFGDADFEVGQNLADGSDAVV